MDNRTEKLRTSRNLNEVMDVVTAIGKQVTKCSTKLSNMRMVSTAAGVIEIGHAGKVTKVAFEGLKNKGEVKKNTETLNDMFDAVQALKSAEAIIKIRFQKQKDQKPALEAIDKLIKNTQATIDAAKTRLEDIAKQHQPAEIATAVRWAKSYLEKNLTKDSYDKIKVETYVNITENDTNQFLNYIRITGFKMEDEFEHDYTKEYYVVVMGEVSTANSSVTMYVTSLFEFKPPGSLTPSVSQKFDNENQLKKALRHLLDHDNIHGFLNQTVMLVDNEDAKHLKKAPNVVDAHIANNKLYVQLTASTTAKQKEKTIQLIGDYLKGLLKVPDLIQPMDDPAVKNGLIFQLVAKRGGHSVNLQYAKLLELAHFMGFSDEQIFAIKQGIKHVVKS